MTDSAAAIIVLAKEPRAGLVKTRLCPPCTAEEAADLARAALIDTLAAVTATPAARRVLVLDGDPGAWVPSPFEVIHQCEGDLARRLTGAFVAVGGPALLVGMDTPQVTPTLLTHALRILAQPATDAVLGPADDGGYWAIGLCDVALPVFEGVPMSTEETGARQLESLLRHGCNVEMLPYLRDVDYYEDAAEVAATMPRSEFAAAFARLDSHAPLARARS